MPIELSLSRTNCKHSKLVPSLVLLDQAVNCWRQKILSRRGRPMSSQNHLQTWPKTLSLHQCHQSTWKLPKNRQVSVWFATCFNLLLTKHFHDINNVDSSLFPPFRICNIIQTTTKWKTTKRAASSRLAHISR